MVEQVECAVVGAGVVGLSVARALARAGREVVVLEAQHAIGTGASSRNSEVVHAGLYYPHGSLKAVTCVRGRQLLYGFCAERSVPHRRCGKLVVATAAEELAALRALQAQAAHHGVELAWLDQAAAQALEPALHCAAALHSPATGIVDSHALMKALLADAEQHGAVLALQSPVLGGEVGATAPLLEVGGEQGMRLRARTVVNCAGLQAAAVAASLRGLPPAAVPRTWLCKGSYFALRAPAPFQRLVYPLHDRHSLGVHLTLDLAGQARFGPDVEWLDGDAGDAARDYDVDPRRADGFVAAIRRYWPELPAAALQPAYAGIRSKLSGPGEPARDFVVDGPGQHGANGLWLLYGIESPGLTAALALGELLAQRVSDAAPA